MAQPWIPSTDSFNSLFGSVNWIWIFKTDFFPPFLILTEIDEDRLPNQLYKVTLGVFSTSLFFSAFLTDEMFYRQRCWTLPDNDERDKKGLLQWRVGW